MKYTHLFFDADGTLFDFNTSEKKALEKAVRTLCGTWNPEIAPLYHQVNKAAWKELEKKHITLEQLKVLRFKNLMEQAGLNFDPAEMSQVYSDFLSQSDDLIPGASELLAELYQNYVLILVTNGITKVQRGRVKTTGTEKFFRSVVISEEIGTAKPDPAFFQVAWEQAGTPCKNQILMIGDSMTSDIQGANNFGIDSCLFLKPGKVLPPLDETAPKPSFIIHNLNQLKEILI